jgi:AcrR family transcriptional regulator
VIEAADEIGLERHGDRRRRQLLRAASLVIEAEGVDAMRMPRVAEVADCARSLVYHYFPTREALFIGVIEHFYERLAERIDLSEQMVGMRGLEDPDAARPILEALWDTANEVGAGGLILRASPKIGAAVNRRLVELAKSFDARWISPLMDLGLGETEATLVFRSAIAIHAELLDRHRRGLVTRDEALDMGQRALAGSVTGLRRNS